MTAVGSYVLNWMAAAVAALVELVVLVAAVAVLVLVKVGGDASSVGECLEDNGAAAPPSSCCCCEAVVMVTAAAVFAADGKKEEKYSSRAATAASSSSPPPSAFCCWASVLPNMVLFFFFFSFSYTPGLLLVEESVPAYLDYYTKRVHVEGISESHRKRRQIFRREGPRRGDDRRNTVRPEKGTLSTNKLA